MPTPLPYLGSYKNVEKCFSGISSAKVPDAFTHAFLQESLGLKSNSDRALIALLRSMGFLDGSNKPTSSYLLLKNASQKGTAIAEGIRQAYKPLFDANERLEKAQSDEIKGLVSQISGQEEGTVSKICGTLNALLKLANFSEKASNNKNDAVEDAEEEENEDGAFIEKQLGKKKGSTANPSFHFNIQVHLPSSSTEEVYLNIFNAIRKVFN